MMMRFSFLLVGCLTLQVSCSNITLNARTTSERREQANDRLEGGGRLAATAFRATVVAAFRQPVTTVKLGFVNLWHRPREVASGNIPLDLNLQAVPGEVPGTREFEEMLDRKHFPRAESGALTWWVDGAGFFPELERQIAAARSSIDVQVFIFDNDDIAVRYADILKRRSLEVPVRVLFDDLGSTFAHTSAPDTLGPRGFVPPADIHGYLRTNSKVQVRRTLNPWLVCDHTKLLVFDQKTAILGGMNIGREYYSEWHDLMVRVEGPIVGSLAREFKRAWRKAGPAGDFALFGKSVILKSPPPLADGGIPLRILRTDPAEGRHEILDAMLLAIVAARQRIWIQTPYFAHDDIALACESAARRGVDVRVILPSKGDSAIMQAGNSATARGLILAGAKVFLYPEMTHLKAMICDDWASVGSANLDTLSLRINRELNLAFSDRATVLDLERTIFQTDFRRSRKMLLSETGSAASAVAETLADQF